MKVILDTLNVQIFASRKVHGKARWYGSLPSYPNVIVILHGKSLEAMRDKTMVAFFDFHDTDSNIVCDQFENAPQSWRGKQLTAITVKRVRNLPKGKVTPFSKAIRRKLGAPVRQKRPTNDGLWLKSPQGFIPAKFGEGLRLTYEGKYAGYIAIRGTCYSGMCESFVGDFEPFKQACNLAYDGDWEEARRVLNANGIDTGYVCDGDDRPITFVPLLEACQQGLCSCSV